MISKHGKHISIFDSMVNHIENHFIVIVLIVAVVVILTPILVKLCFSGNKPMTQDGLLSYIGTTIYSVITLFVAYVAVNQSKIVTKIITLNGYRVGFVVVDSSYIELSQSRLPKEIELNYIDVDNNCISEVHKLYDEDNQIKDFYYM